MTREELIEFAKYLDEGCDLLGEGYIESRTDEFLQKMTNKNMKTKKEILDLVELFNLETFNVNDRYFCIKGINGNATVVYYDNNPITTVKNHLIQVGRDSLKMDLNYLLDITKHN
jgi:hypothetical protein